MLSICGASTHARTRAGSLAAGAGRAACRALTGALTAARLGQRVLLKRALPRAARVHGGIGQRHPAAGRQLPVALELEMCGRRSVCTAFYAGCHLLYM